MLVSRFTRTPISLLLLACGQAARGAHPLITEGAATKGAGNLQLELSLESSRDEESRVRTAFLVGLTARW